MKRVPRIVPACTLSLTARRVVDVVITELCVFRIEGGALRLVELMSSATLDEVRAKTTAPFVEALGTG